MTVTVSPNTAHPTHHLKLSDSLRSLGLVITDGRGNANPKAWSRNPIPRQTLKMYSGQTTWADMEPPWTPIGQDDWSGGRGNEDFDKDSTRYYDGWMADTTRANEITLGGHPVYAYGHRTLVQSWPYRSSSGGELMRTLSRLTAATPYYAVRFIPTVTLATATIRKLVFLAAASMSGAGANLLDVDIYTNVGGFPGASIWHDTVANYSNFTNQIVYHTANIGAAVVDLTAGTSYWLVFHHAGTATNYWELLTTTDPKATAATKTPAGAWAASDANPWFRVLAPDDDFRAHFFEYRGALYAVLSYEDAGAVRVMLNGDHGVASAGTANTLTDDDKAGANAWVVNEWAGCVLKICEGTGSMAENPYAVIESNTADTLTLSTNLEIAPAAGTIYAILASDKWKEINDLGGAHGMTGKITDVQVSGYVTYICRGDSTAIMKFWAWDNAGVWTNEFAADATAVPGPNCAFYMEHVGDQVWRALRGTCEVSAAPAAAYAGGAGVPPDLVFAAADVVGNVSDKITNITEYNGDLWILKEGSVYTHDGTNLDIVPLYGMGAVQDPRNGYSAAKSGVYLYFSLQDSLERYYANTLDDIGPNRDSGLPSDRRGFISCMTAYPGRLFAAIDGGDLNYSSILVRNQMGWHEAYRAPFNFGGHRILGIHPQSIPGDSVDRLWFSCGSDLVWIPLSLNPVTHPLVTYNSYPYTWESHVITAWMYLSMKDVEKFYHSAKIVQAEAVDGVDVEFQVFGFNPWYSVGDFITTFYERDLQMTAPNDVSGRALRLRLRLRSNGTQTTPRVLASVVEAISRIPYKYATSFTCRIADSDTDLEGDPDGQGTADTRLARLEGWAASALPVTLNAVSDLFDGTTVLVEAPAVQPNKIITAEGREAHLVQVTLIEV